MQSKGRTLPSGRGSDPAPVPRVSRASSHAMANSSARHGSRPPHGTDDPRPRPPGPVPTLVLSPDGRVVPNLQPADFRLFDDDSPRPFTLDVSANPVSVAIAVQANQDIRAYLPFIAKAGNALDALLVGEAGESAVIVYGDEVRVAKPFDSGDLSLALRTLAPDGRTRAPSTPGCTRSIFCAHGRPRGRACSCSSANPRITAANRPLRTSAAHAGRDNVTVHALALPEIGKTFVSDTFSLQGFSSQQDRGGFKAAPISPVSSPC